jgi:hypothetical protein
MQDQGKTLVQRSAGTDSMMTGSNRAQSCSNLMQSYKKACPFKGFSSTIFVYRSTLEEEPCVIS